MYQKTAEIEKDKIRVEALYFYYNNQPALKNITLSIKEREITALIGPFGCGKSTFLRCLNRMNDTIPKTRHTGYIWLDGDKIYNKAIQVVELRRRVGMVLLSSLLTTCSRQPEFQR